MKKRLPQSALTRSTDGDWGGTGWSTGPIGPPRHAGRAGRSLGAQKIPTLGDDPDGYRTLAEVIEFVASYADAISAPVLTHTTVTSVRSTDWDIWCRRSGRLAVPGGRIASGACNVADVPNFANRVCGNSRN